MQQEHDHRVVDRLREFRTLAGRNFSVPSPQSALSHALSSSPQKKQGLMGRLFGSHAKEKEVSTPVPPPDNSAALERFFADVESTMRTIQDCQATLDNLEPQCQVILSELYLYKDEKERTEAVERQVMNARQQLMGVQETMRKFLGARVPAEHVDLCQRWRTFTVDKCGPLYTYFLDRVAKMRELLRQRRRRQLLVADPTLKEENLVKLLDSDPFDVFTAATAKNGLKPPEAPKCEELHLWAAPAP